MTRSILVSAAVAACAFGLPAQTLRLDRTGGVLGRTLAVRVSGTPGKAFVMLPSLGPGPTPLRILDRRDPRSLEVGLDLLAFLAVGATRASPVVLPFPIPNDPGLAGKVLHFHGFLLPGTTFLAGPLSNPLRATLGGANTWVGRGKVLAGARALAGAAALAGGRFLLAGGGAGDLLNARGLATTEVYDADRQTFAKGPNLGTARALLRTVTLKNGKVLVTGGVDGLGRPLRTCEIFDPATNRFTPTGSMRIARAGHTADLLPNGKVLVSGGTPTFRDPLAAITSAERSSELYDPATGTFGAGPAMSRPRLAHVSVALRDGRILLAGGATFTKFFFVKIPGITNACEVYDPARNRFSPVGSMPSARAGHALTRLANGDVLVTGGARLVSVTDIRTIRNAATFGRTTGRWTATANKMATARAIQATARLPDGRVLVIGGATGSLTAPAATAGCELFDPRTRRFTAAPSLGTARAGAQALLLPEGPVFVAGGGGGSGNRALDTGEMYFVR